MFVGGSMRCVVVAASFALALVAAGCPGSERIEPRPSIRTISTWLGSDHWGDDGSVTSLRGPPPGVAVSVLVPDEASQGYRVIPGSVGMDGGVTIPEVPLGDYLLMVETPYAIQGPSPRTGIDTRVVQFNTSAPPLTRLASHRADLSRASRFTPVQLNVTNLDPASERSQLWAGSSAADLDLLLATPAAGATEYAGEVDWAGPVVPEPYPVGLPSGGRGDVVHVVQRARLPLPAWPDATRFLLTTRAARTSDVSIVDGVGGTLAVALAEVPLSRTIQLELAATAFEALGSSGAPPGLPVAYSALSAGLYAAPHSVTYPAPSRAFPAAALAEPGPWLRLFYAEAEGPLAPDANLGTISYGDLLDDLWVEFLRVYFRQSRRYTHPVTGTSFEGSTDVEVSLPRSEVPAGRIAPILGPPTSPRINGKDAWSLQVGVGIAPLLSWGRPSIGQQAAYEVQIVPADPLDRGVSARLHGTESFRVPPGILEAGHFYYAIISAVAGPGYALDMNPNVASLPRHRAGCLTELFSP